MAGKHSRSGRHDGQLIRLVQQTVAAQQTEAYVLQRTKAARMQRSPFRSAMGQILCVEELMVHPTHEYAFVYTKSAVSRIKNPDLWSKSSVDRSIATATRCPRISVRNNNNLYYTTQLLDIYPSSLW